jgi:hypothetical protein
MTATRNDRGQSDEQEATWERADEGSAGQPGASVTKQAVLKLGGTVS